MLDISDIIADSWCISRRVGRGTFSEIFLAFNIHNDSQVAIKVKNPSIEGNVLKVEFF